MNKYIENYFDAFRAMREAAIKTIKEYGKELDVCEECKKVLMETHGYKSEDEIDEEELNNLYSESTYSCFFTDKHGAVYEVTVSKVRYNEKYDDIDVYLDSDDGYISEWFPVSMACHDEAAYMTILDFIEQ